MAEKGTPVSDFVLDTETASSPGLQGSVSSVLRGFANTERRVTRVKRAPKFDRAANKVSIPSGFYDGTINNIRWPKTRKDTPMKVQNDVPHHPPAAMTPQNGSHESCCALCCARTYYRLDQWLARRRSQVLIITFSGTLSILLMGTLFYFLGPDTFEDGTVRAWDDAIWDTWTFMTDPGTHADTRGRISRLVAAATTIIGALLLRRVCTCMPADRPQANISAEYWRDNCIGQA